MSEQIIPSVLMANIPLPEQDLDQLSFCASNKPAVLQKWLENLRATQVTQTSIQLYTAMPEIARLKIAYPLRLEMLEIVRTRVQDCIEGLQKGFLNQPIIMPEEAQKAVLIAQTMQKAMIDGYLACVQQITQLSKAKKNTMEDLARSIHRAITGIGLLHFRSCQIYTQIPQQLWRSLHCLYQIADYFDIATDPVEDPILKSSRTLNVNAAYVRVLMMASAKTNQLSQNDIAIAYQAFEGWSKQVLLRPPSEKSEQNYLLVNLRGEQGPTAKSKVKQHVDRYFLEIDFSPLLNQLKRTGESNSPSHSQILSDDFPTPLLKHLRDAWETEAIRKVDRRNVASVANVCIGLVDCHYFCSNGISFDDFIALNTSQPKLPSGIPQGVTPDSQFREESKPSHRVNIQNSSPGGYCLLWQGKIPVKVVAGEIIGVKEVGRRSWDLGVIRWVKQLKGASQLGIQILSHNPKPYAIAQTYSMGGFSDYMRGFYIPASRFGQSEPSLITGAVPFEEHDKVKVADGEQEWSAQLDDVIFATKNIQQFNFQTFDKIGDITKASRSTIDEQQSSWDDI